MGQTIPVNQRRLDTNFYNESYFVGRTKSNYPNYPALRNSQLVKARAKFIRQFFKPKRTLEIGCAMGFEVEQLRKKKVDAWGCDISDWAIENSPEEIQGHVWVQDITKSFRFPDNYFDVVYSYDVLEHIEDDDLDKTMAELQRIGRFNYHRVATKEDPRDLDQSHITMYPVDEWEERYPNIYFAGSDDPDDYSILPPTSKPCLKLIQFFNQHPYGNRNENGSRQLRPEADQV